MSEGGIHDSDLRRIDFLEVVGGGGASVCLAIGRISYPMRWASANICCMVGVVAGSGDLLLVQGDGHPRRIHLSNPHHPPHMSLLLDAQRRSVPRAGVSVRVSLD